MSWRTIVFVGTLACANLSVRRARADDATCPTEAAVLEAVRARVPRMKRDAVGRVAFEREASGFRAHVSVEENGRITMDRVIRNEVDSCASVADASVIVLALGLEDLTPVSPGPPTPVAPSAPRARTVPFTVHADAIGAVGLTPTPTIGPRVGARIHATSDIHVDVSLLALAPRRTADQGFLLGLAAASVELCWSRSVAIRPFGCVGPMVGAFSASSRAATVAPAGLTLLAGISARAGILVTTGLFTFGFDGGIVVPATQPVFRPEACGLNGFQPSSTAGMLGFSVGRSFL